MNLSKDDMYGELLKPYKHERLISRDSVYLKTKYTYLCKYDDCNKFFTKACNFLDHVRMHEEIKPYQCLRCKVSFVQHCNLVKHKKLHCGDQKGKKNYRCEKCNRTFTEKTSLEVRCHCKYC